MNEDTTLEFLKFTYGRFAFAPQNQLLSWDSFRAHLTKDVKDDCKKKKVNIAVIPGGRYLYSITIQKKYN